MRDNKFNLDTPIEIVFQGVRSRAICSNPDAPNLLVRFEHFIAGKHNFAPPNIWQVAHDRNFAQLHVQVSQSDFYLNDDLPALRRNLHVFTRRFAQTRGLGFSMGAFGALLLSRALRLRYCVLVSPQRPRFPSCPPFKTDVEAEAAHFCLGGDTRLDGVQADMRGVVLFDPLVALGRDMAYASAISEFLPRLKSVALPGAGHPATQTIVQAKLYGKFRECVLEKHGIDKRIRLLHELAYRSARGTLELSQ